MAEVLAKTTFSSVIHNNEVCDEIVKWGNANGYPVTVESYEPEERIIPLNVKPETGEINRFIVKMMEEYVKEGLKMELAENIYESYGTHLRDLKVVGHPILINNFEDFIENMR